MKDQKLRKKEKKMGQRSGSVNNNNKNKNEKQLPKRLVGSWEDSESVNKATSAAPSY